MNAVHPHTGGDGPGHPGTAPLMATAASPVSLHEVLYPTLHKVLYPSRFHGERIIRFHD